MTRYFGRDGQPISVEDWVRLGTDPHYRTVERTVVGDYLITTIWLGIDFSYQVDASDTLPILFETIVIGGDALGRRDLGSQRYVNEDDARRGHHDTVTLVRATTVFVDD